MANIRPNRFLFESHDGSTKVAYETSSFLGEPVLNLLQGSTCPPIRPFSGSQIRILNTEIGSLVTVTTQIAVDTGSSAFNVLIPEVTLTSASDRLTFTTEAIVTADAGPNSVPGTRMHETYQFIPLKGEASFAVSLVQPVMGAVAKATTP
jgi:hypothetical protein